MTKVYIETIMPRDSYYYCGIIDEVGHPELVALTLQDPDEGTRVLCNTVIYEYSVEDVINGGEEKLVIGPNLWTGIGKARLGVSTALVGSGENVANRLQEYADIGLDTFILSGYPHLEEAERFGKYVMPYFAGKKTQAAAAA